ncbi:MAG: tetratricopeptide repeat protein [Alphaproteobacteria bacterium]
MLRVLTGGLLSLALLLAPTVQAHQDDPRLGPLFERLQSTGDPGEAGAIQASIWRIWLESDDEKVNQLMKVGRRAMAIGDFDEADVAFTEMIKRAPDFAEGWNKRATLYYLMGLSGRLRYFEASIRDVERTLALEPRHFGALSGMGLIHTALEDEALALEWFERALGVNPHMPYIKERVRRLKEKIEGKPI